MLVEEQKLRWRGIDMRLRWRRRMAVVLTYTAFLVITWHASARMSGLMIGLMWIAIIFSLRPSIDDAGFAMRWVARGICILAAGFEIYQGWHHPQDYGQLLTGGIALFLLWMHSVVGLGGGLVDHGRPNWMAVALRKGDAASTWEKRRLARKGFAIGLEGFARYEYMTKFRNLTEEQKKEIESVHQANPRGKWMREFKSVLFDDERLQNEEAQLRARVQKIMNWVLVGLAFVSAIVLDDDCKISAHVMVAGLWTLAAMMTTLRQAISLWTESDPREVAGELMSVGEAQA